MANFANFRALLNKNGQMIDWIVTKFLIIAQDVIKLHSNKNFNVFSLGILKCVSFWRRHIFYQKVFICPSMLHKHFMVLKKTWKGTGYFFFKRCNQIFFKVANLYAIYFYISIFIPHKNNNKKKPIKIPLILIRWNHLVNLPEFSQIYPNLLKIYSLEQRIG